MNVIIALLLTAAIMGVLWWLTIPELRVELRLRLDRFDRWRRRQCRWCHQRRLPALDARFSGNVHAFVARQKGLCYDCAKAWVHASNHSGLHQTDPELLVRLSRVVRRGK